MKESQKSGNKGFQQNFLLVDGRILIRRNIRDPDLGGPGRPKNFWILWNLEHCLVHIINVQIVGANYQDVKLSLSCSVCESDHGS
jgi:hypothetical protein